MGITVGGIRRPRLGCVEIEDNKYVFTEIGLAHIRELSSLGCSIPEIAKYLKISAITLSARIDSESEQFDEEVADAFEDGEHELKRRLREGQQALAQTNAQMSIHLGKHHLGQKDVQQIEVTKRVHIVGTLPDYDQKPDQWLKDFAPTPLQQVPEKPKVIDAVDVEFEESKPDAPRKITPRSD